MGNLIPHFSSAPMTPSPSTWSSSAANPTSPSGAPSSECGSSTTLAVGTPWRSVTPDQSRWPARPVPWGPASRSATTPSAGSPWRGSPRPRRLFTSAVAGQSGQSSGDESPSCTVPWASPTGSGGTSSPASPWPRSSSSCGAPSPICSPLDREEGPYGRNAYFACSPGPFTSTPQRS